MDLLVLAVPTNMITHVKGMDLELGIGRARGI